MKVTTTPSPLLPVGASSEWRASSTVLMLYVSNSSCCDDDSLILFCRNITSKNLKEDRIRMRGRSFHFRKERIIQDMDSTGSRNILQFIDQLIHIHICMSTHKRA